MTTDYINVSTYSGYKANERPLSFIIGYKRLKVMDILERWSEPDKDFFKVIADDHKIYTLSLNRKTDKWLMEKVSEKDED